MTRTLGSKLPNTSLTVAVNREVAPAFAVLADAAAVITRAPLASGVTTRFQTFVAPPLTNETLIVPATPVGSTLNETSAELLLTRSREVPPGVKLAGPVTVKCAGTA